MPQQFLDGLTKRLAFANGVRARLRVFNSRKHFYPSLLSAGLAFALLTVAANNGVFRFSSNSVSADALDAHLLRAATAALGDRRGTVIVMDPQTGRIRAVVNPQLAFEETLPLGSTIKPFTALAALRLGVIDDDTRTACREDYARGDFHTVCSHPRGLPPLNPTEAIAYSCNYYFGKVGERLNEPSFVSTLSEFGFGRKTGVNAPGESQGKLLRDGSRPESAIGENENFLATPIQLINAYSALVNGGHLFTPQIRAASGFSPASQSDLSIKDEYRTIIVKGMRGSVRYGTAETAALYKLPLYIFGKTGTATQVNGFRSQGWFVGFASQGGSVEESPASPTQIKLAVLVFLTKAHGSEAAELARPIFEEFARSDRETVSTSVGKDDGHDRTSPANPNPSDAVSRSSYEPSLPSTSVRIHLGKENITQTISLEDYVRSVVATEGSTENELEALRALAIASRTFAVKNMGRHKKDGYDFCSTTHCQRYRLQSPTDYVSPAVVEAVRSTAGQILIDSHGDTAESYFSASCGGATANKGTLWGGIAPPYLRGVADEYCASEPHESWTDVISREQMLKAVQSDPRTTVGAQLHNLTVLKRDQSGRAELIAVEGDRRTTISGWEFKIIVGRALGWQLLKSSRFDITRSGSNFVFRGKGFGHGLGLCQEGAHVMASRGSSYREILTKYFPTTRIATAVQRKGSADLMWPTQPTNFNQTSLHFEKPARTSRQTLASENFTVNYPLTVDRRDIESLLKLLQSTRKNLIDRVAAAGMGVQIPSLEIFVNETTGDFVGRTGQPFWAAAATKNNRIEIQPLSTLRRRRVLETTMRHELVHALIDNLGKGRTPRWLAEGLAIHFAGEGPMVSRYQPRQSTSEHELDRKLDAARSADDMRAAYAAAYAEVKRLLSVEGEARVWRRVAG